MKGSPIISFKYSTLILMIALVSCNKKMHPTSVADHQCIQMGKASYYAEKFNGRQTANGEIFYSHNMTAAHKTLPFGTIVKVTNLVNNRWVVVRINDRGPFVSGRIIDLSKAAAEKIDLIDVGVVDVEIVCQ